MITGDNQVTAEAIAQKVGIVDGDCTGRSFTGRDIEAMSEEDRQSMLKTLKGGGVFSRTEPKHKQIIVKSLKNVGEIAAMTGDGVNDAPALKQADIGIAMGIAGTEVAKEAADMVLVDDNFSTIVNAVEEGRSIYSNMKAFIRYLISSNIGEVASIFLTAAMGIPEGLVPVQLLWVNLVTDGPPATALGFNPAEPDVMKKPPRGKDEALISGWVFIRYMVVGLYVGFATVGILVYWYCFDTTAPDQHSLVTMEQLMSWGQCSTWKDFSVTPFGNMKPGDSCSYFTAGKDKASSLSLTVLVVIEMLNAFNALCEDTSLLVVPPWRNPYLFVACAVSIGVHFVILYVPILATIFGVVPLTTHDWTLVMAFSSPVILVDEFLKVIGRQINRSPPGKEKTE
jgi:Ca2+-transporting ATPase